MGLSIGALAFIGAVVGGATSAGIAYHKGGDPISAGLMGAAMGGAGGALGGAIGGAPLAAGASASTAEVGVLGAAGAMSGEAAMSGASGFGASVGAAGGESLFGGLSGAFLETVPSTAVGSAPTAINTAQTGLGAAVEGAAPTTGGFQWTSLINPAIKVGGQVTSALLEPDALEYPLPVAPPLIREEDPLALKKFEETPEAIDARIARESRADEMFSRARALEELRSTSTAAGAQSAGGKTFNEFFQKPRTAQERFIGASPTIGAGRY